VPHPSPAGNPGSDRLDGPPGEYRRRFSGGPRGHPPGSPLKVCSYLSRTPPGRFFEKGASAVSLTSICYCGTCHGPIVLTWTGRDMHRAPHVCPATAVQAPAAAPLVPRVLDEPCERCGAAMSGPTHRANCRGFAPRPVGAPAVPPAAAPALDPGPGPDLEPPGDWCVDELGRVVQPDGSRWEGDEDPPGVDVRTLTRRPHPAPTSGQDASAASPPGRPTPPAGRRASGAPRRSTWTPLPAPPPDTPWRVTRDVEVRTLSPNRLVQEHWKGRAGRRNSEHKAVRKAFEGSALPPIDRGLIVTFVRVAAVLSDDDAIPPCLKSPRDAVADLYGVDDSHRSPIEWRYLQHVERVKEPHTYRARPAARLEDGRLRAAKPARVAWRYRCWLRVTIETAVEHAGSGADAACVTGEASSLCPWGPRCAP
jgi:hypothetical protein